MQAHSSIVTKSPLSACSLGVGGRAPNLPGILQLFASSLLVSFVYYSAELSVLCRTYKDATIPRRQIH